MRRGFLILTVLCLLALLCGCTARKNNPPSDAPAQTAFSSDAPAQADFLPGVWVNAGRYSEGRDFVETLTVGSDGTVKVHLDYQGSPYADLTGTWQRVGAHLSFRMSDGSIRDYEYAASERALTLTGGGKTVEYQRKEINLS